MGAIIGTITLCQRSHQLAPSTLAASMMSDGMEVRPANTMMALNGNPRQMLTVITATMA